MRSFRAVVLVAALSAAAPAVAKAPQAVAPKVSVKAASAVGSALSVTLTVTLPGVTSGCSGTVTASTKVAKKARRLTGKLAQAGGVCSALVSGKLPGTTVGATETFTIQFKGNSKIKAFSKSKTLKLAAPAPATPPATTTLVTTTPADTTTTDQTPAQTTPTTPAGPPGVPFFDTRYVGIWGTYQPNSGPDDRFRVTILNDGTVGFDAPGGFKWYCGSPGSESLTTINFLLLYQGSGAFTAQNHAQDGRHRASGAITADVSWSLDFDGPTLGTGHGTMTASGTNGATPCSVTVAFDFGRSGV